MTIPSPFALFFAICTFLGLFQAPAVQAATTGTPTEQLVGTWAETGGKDSLVTINKDGSFKLYLKKGEIEDKHYLEGTWKLNPDGKFVVSLNIGDKPDEFSAQLKFEGDEMVLVDDEGKETRHKRHDGPIPERFNW